MKIQIALICTADKGFKLFGGVVSDKILNRRRGFKINDWYQNKLRKTKEIGPHEYVMKVRTIDLTPDELGKTFPDAGTESTVFKFQPGYEKVLLALYNMGVMGC